MPTSKERRARRATFPGAPPCALAQDPIAYDRQAARLVEMFVANFAKFEEHVDGTVLAAAPTLAAAAE